MKGWCKEPLQLNRQGWFVDVSWVKGDYENSISSAFVTDGFEFCYWLYWLKAVFICETCMIRMVLKYKKKVRKEK